PLFTAPDVSEPTPCRVRLTVQSTSGQDNDDATVLVEPGPRGGCSCNAPGAAPGCAPGAGPGAAPPAGLTMLLLLFALVRLRSRRQNRACTRNKVRAAEGSDGREVI
ncbi:MAG: hypothetical protein ABI333_03045, partial [bacterium]